MYNFQWVTNDCADFKIDEPAECVKEGDKWAFGVRNWNAHFPENPVHSRIGRQHWSFRTFPLIFTHPAVKSDQFS